MNIGLRTGNPLDKRLFEIWRKMHYRCRSPKHKHYKDYGGRGISICEEWYSFVYFALWAINNGYKDNLTLDRIDNDGNYEPNNCRWVTMQEQLNNRRIGEHIEIENKTKSFSIRQRGQKWEYRVELPPINNKRVQITKCGFTTKEEAIEAAKKYILDNVDKVA